MQAEMGLSGANERRMYNSDLCPLFEQACLMFLTLDG